MTKSEGALTLADVQSAYARWAPFYDVAFSFVMRRGRRALATAVTDVAGRVLDVGVGTGLELPMFHRAVRLVGVDLSEPMLRRCEHRVRSAALANVEGLVVMDAMQLAFGDQSFDAAVAPFVLTVTPDPHRMLDELVRVVKPGGRIVLVNHIGADSGPIHWIERALAKQSASLGWRPLFPWSIVTDWLSARRDVRLIERKPLPPLGIFSLIHMVKA